MMWSGSCAFDADGHILEPSNMWRQYIAPEFRNECIRVARDADDGDKLIVRGRVASSIRRLGGLEVNEASPAVTDWNSLACESYAPYEASCLRASFNGPARVSWLREQGLDGTLLFPSLTLLWPQEVDPDTPYTVEHLLAYNRWLWDFSEADRSMLIPVAMVSESEYKSSRVQLLEAVEIGYRHVLFPLGCSNLESASLRDFLQEAAHCGVAIHMHKMLIPHLLELPSPTRLGLAQVNALAAHMTDILPAQLFLAGLMGSSVLERYPALQWRLHEVNVAWLPAWLSRADDSCRTLRETNRWTGTEALPSERVLDLDTFGFSTGLDEDPGDFAPNLLRITMMATDFPHPGSPTSPHASWSKVEFASEESRAAFVGLNARRLLRLP